MRYRPEFIGLRCRPAVPSGLSFSRHESPTLKRWAIVACPSGTDVPLSTRSHRHRSVEFEVSLPVLRSSPAGRACVAAGRRCCAESVSNVQTAEGGELGAWSLEL